MFKTGFLNPQKLPLVIEPETKEKTNFRFLADILTTESAFLYQKILTHGALLFRNFGLENVSELEKFARLFSGKKLLHYAGGTSPRSALSKSGIYTSTEYPADLILPLHNELSYTDSYPNHLYFCCFIAPGRGGETTLGDSRRILKKMDQKIVELFKRKKVCYVRNLQSEKGTGYAWPEAFETDDKREVENQCRKIGASFEWKPDGSLRLSQIRPATLIHPTTQEEVWFNQADGFHASIFGEEIYRSMPEEEFRLNAYFGDGSPIDIETLRHVRAVIKTETIPHKWQKGDVLVIDNILAAHGRAPFSGARKISLAMT